MAKPLPSLKDILATPGPAAGAATSSGGLPSAAELPSLKDVLATPGPHAKKKKGGGGLLGTLKHVVTQGGADLYHAAVNTPAGIAAVVTAAAHDISKGNIPNPADPQSLVKWWKTSESAEIDKAMAKGALKTLQHPLRNPGDTAMLLAPGVGALSKVALVGRSVKAGEVAGRANIAKALVTKNPTPPRVLKVGGMETRGHYSRASTAQVVQRATDAGLQKAAQTSERAENILHKRVAKWEGRNQRVADAVARAPGSRLSALGKSLKPEELRALRLVAEEVPVARRLGAQEMRKARATGKEVGRHQERIDVTKGALAFLDEHPTSGAPVFKPSAKKLQNVYGALKAASSDREAMLKNLGLMDDASQQAAKTKVARIAAGGRYVKPEEAAARAAALEQTGSATTEFLTWARDYMNRANARRAKAATDAQSKAENAAFAAGTRRTAAEKEALQAAAASAKESQAAVKPVYAAADASRTARARLADQIDRAATRVEKLSDEATFALVRVAEGTKPPAHAAKAVAKLHASRADLSRLRDAARREARSGAAIASEQALHKLAGESRATIATTGLAAAERDAQLAYKAALEHLGKTRAARRSAESTVGAVDAKMRWLAEQAAQKSDAAAAAARSEAGRIVGAEDITASPGAVFIGNPVERARLTGKPKVSSTGTFGHTQKPSSLRTSTGSSVEHALERQDVTNVVAERHAEAVRLSTIDRVRNRVKPAGEAVPRRKDDVFMWTDKLISNERIPQEVRRYLDNPESLASRPPTEQVSIAEQIKQAVFERRDWRDPATVAEFTRLAEEGKGVFVPRRLLGNYAKREIVGSGPVVHFADAVNNAQKAGLVYLKVNYPVVQALSNTAMNLIQGAANPHKITKAVKVYHGDPELVSVAEDIMGQGAILQAAFEGQGTIARGTQKLAHVMSHKVDTPARLLALYHEADLAGFGSKARFRELIFDEKNAKALAEVAQRAKEAIVDYGELSPFERGVVRRLIFVYPWQKGATKYAGHFLRDHPVQAAALDQVSQQAGEPFGPVPSYLKGAFKVGGGLVNPSGVNFFETPAQIGQAVAGLLGGNPAASAQGQNFLAPFGGTATALLTGRDDFGRPLQGNLAAKLRDLLVAPTPIAGVGRAAAPNIDLVKALLGDRTSSKSFPNPNDAFYRFLIGGLYPRDYNKPALNRNAALEKSGR